MIDSTSSGGSLDEETGVRMVALFDHEEVGSNSAQGAGSPVILDAMSRITNSLNSSNNKVEVNYISHLFTYYLLNLVINYFLPCYFY